MMMNSRNIIRVGGVLCLMAVQTAIFPASVVRAGPVATVQAGAISNSPFVDVAADYDFKNAIQFLKDKKIVKGYPDQTYKPEVLITRAEFLKMAMKLGGQTTDITKIKSPFNDVAPTDWFYGNVLMANKLGIATGYGNGKFGPYDTMTRVQALKLAFLAMQLSPSIAPKTLKDVSALYDTLPPDVNISSWYVPYVMTARKLFIMSDSDSDGKFYPDEMVDRGMAAEILYRISAVKGAGAGNGNAVPAGPVMFNITSEWNTYTAAGLGISFKMPKIWSVVTDGSRVTVWKKDAAFPLDPDFVTPLTAKIIFKTPTSESSTNAADFFAKVKAQSVAAYPSKELVYANMMIDGRPVMRVKVTADGIENWYMYFSGTKAMTINSQYGISTLTPKLRETLRAIAKSLVVTAAETGGTGNGGLASTDAIASAIQSKILVEKVGKATIDTLGDALIILTDDIGVGTGAVDYYYSEKIQMTLKYERASDTILAVRTGKTTAF